MANNWEKVVMSGVLFIYFLIYVASVVDDSSARISQFSVREGEKNLFRVRFQSQTGSIVFNETRVRGVPVVDRLS